MGRIATRGIVEKDGRFLIVKLRLYNTFWCVPGGGLDEGEDLLSGLTREMIEETGIKPVIGNLLFVHQVKKDGLYLSPEFFFHIKNADDYLNIDLSQTSHGMDEIEEIGFKEISQENLLPKFLKDELPKAAKANFEITTKVFYSDKVA